MNIHVECGKKKWSTPRLVELDVSATKTGIGGSSADFLNYDPTSPTATNTDTS
jgi:hypothetical protein